MFVLAFNTALEGSLDDVSCYYVLVLFCVVTYVFMFYRSCQSMTSLYSATVSPVKDSSSSPLCRPSNKPPLRALYDLLIAPMEGVRMCVMYVDCT